MIGVPERAKHACFEEETSSLPFLRLDEDGDSLGDTGWRGSGSASSQAGSFHDAIPTPPPEASPTNSPKYAPAVPSAPESATQGDSFVKGSSLDVTPEPSPGCSPAVKADEPEEEAAKKTGGRSLKRSRSGSEGESSEDEELPVPKNLKLPISKFLLSRLL